MDLGSVFGNIGNFFGFNQKKKKEAQPAPVTRQPLLPTAMQIPRQNTGGVQMPQPFAPTAAPINEAPQLGGVKLSTFSDEDRKTADKIVKKGGDPSTFLVAANKATVAKNKAEYDNSAFGLVANTAGTVVKDLAQATARVPETIFRSALLEPLVGNATRSREQAVNTDSAENTGIRSFLYGNEPVQSYQSQGRDFQAGVNDFTDNKTLANAAVIAGPALAALDLFTGGKGKASVTAARRGLEAIPARVESKVDDLMAGTTIPESQVRKYGWPESQIEDNLGREKLPEINQAPPREPGNPITSSPTTNKAPAITSANPNFVKPTTITQPQPFDIGTGQAPNTPPQLGGVAPLRAPEPAPVVNQAQLADEQAIQDIIDQAAVRPPVAPPEVISAPVETPLMAQSRAAANEAPPISPEIIAEAVQAERAAQAPTEAIADGLGKITRGSVIDGSINTPDGIGSMLSRVETAAQNESTAAGSSLEDIISKGQKVWQKSKSEKRDLTTREAQELDKSFTPEQQSIYKAYAQEISTLRDRAGFTLDGGQQGEWYGPRQSLSEDGASAEFNPSMVNEIKRNKDQISGGVDEGSLDTSAAPHQQAIQRYANAPDASTRVLVETVETNLDTGAPSGIKVPDEAKQRLEKSMSGIITKRDEALKLEDAGDSKGANKLRGEVEGDVRQAFNDFIDDIPGSGSERRQAINNVKDIRNTYMQTTMQTLSLSNVVNRVADVGAKVVYKATRPLAKGLEKGLSGKYASDAAKASPSVEAGSLNTSKEARKAAKEFSRGTLGREVRDNFMSNMSLAGAGRGLVGKGAAKLEALPRAANSALTQGAGDLSTQNVQRALELGASRPEAASLKTVDDYKKYFGEYINSNNFKQDLDNVRTENNPRIGLAGARGDNMGGGGKLANWASKELDNAVRTNAERAGIKPNRLIDEVNDYVKGNVTGYAGVGTRVLGRVLDSATLGGLRRASKIANSGAENAGAQAAQVAAQGVADTIATYGAAGAAILVTSASAGAIGFTGDQPTYGSSDASANKANNVPPNQWYVNIGDERVYFDPSRPLGAPGVAMNVAGSTATGKNPASAAASAGNQLYNQVGGSSLPETLVNIQTALNPASPEGSKKFASERLQATAAPSTGILNNFANWGDDLKRAPKNFLDDIKANVPFLRGSVPVAKDSRGKDIANSKQISGGSGLFSVAKNTDSAKVKAEDPVGTEINRLQKLSGDVFPTNQNSNATDTKTTEYSELLLDSPLYKDGDDAAKGAYMKEVLAGTKTKEINASLDTPSKQALIEYTLQSDAKRKAWLDDNANAASYYGADYNNAKANSTLTVDDDNLQNKSGKKYKSLRANVNQEVKADKALQLLYEDISPTEWKAMIDPDSEDYDLPTANRLFNYDEARTKAGVSGKSADSSKPKFSQKKAGKGGKGGGGKSDNFAFASLPGSLLGNSAGSGKSGYADNAPTFKPIADLQAPATVVIPKGRNISVKKGIQL